MYMAFAIISNTNHDMAREIFYAFDSFSGKRSLLQRVLGTGIDEEDTKLVKQIIDAVGKANNQRTELAHAALLFETEGDRSSFTLYRSKHGETIPVTINCLKTWRDHSVEACVEAGQAFQTLSEKHGRPLTITLK